MPYKDKKKRREYAKKRMRMLTKRRKSDGYVEWKIWIKPEWRKALKDLLAALDGYEGQNTRKGMDSTERRHFLTLME